MDTVWESAMHVCEWLARYTAWQCIQGCCMVSWRGTQAVPWVGTSQLDADGGCSTIMPAKPTSLQQLSTDRLSQQRMLTNQPLYSLFEGSVHAICTC